MADELESAAPDELALPANEPEAVEPETLEAEAPEEGDDAELPEATPEEIEIEHEGQKYRVPKALEGYLLRHDDYTRKTQELSVGRKELDQVREHLAQQARLDEQEMGARVTVKAIDAELAKYQGVDWTSEFQKDFANATAHKARYDQLKEQRGQAEQFVNQRTQQRTEEAKRESASRITATRDWATKNIKGWNEALDKQITDFAIGQGMTPEFLGQNVNPLLYGLLHRAYVGDQALKRASAAPKPKPGEQPKPLSTVSSRTGGPAVKRLSEMTVADHAEALRKEKEARRRA